MTTVLTLPGADSLGNMATVQAAFGGPQALLTQLGDTTQANVQGVVYNDWDPVFGYLDGANKAAAAIKTALTAGGNVVAVGHSYGAVSLVQLIRSDTTLLVGVDPTKVIFVLCGNSVRPNNGLCGQCGEYGGYGPTTTKWRVYDAARQFDKWADYPNNLLSADYWQAVGNCNAGDQTTGTGSVNGVPNNIHNSYQNVRLNDPNAAKATVGSVTFMLFETDPPPNPSGVTRTQLETAYNRVVTPAGW